jgi:hypothetical protein
MWLARLSAGLLESRAFVEKLSISLNYLIVTSSMTKFKRANHLPLALSVKSPTGFSHD